MLATATGRKRAGDRRADRGVCHWSNGRAGNQQSCDEGVTDIGAAIRSPGSNFSVSDTLTAVSLRRKSALSLTDSSQL